MHVRLRLLGIVFNIENKLVKDKIYKQGFKKFLIKSFFLIFIFNKIKFFKLFY
jgi:hypothetical protein